MKLTAWPRAKTEIERLTIRYQGSADEIDTTTLRLRIERLLEMEDLQPADLPSSAILIVRKLEGRAPLSVAALSRSSLPAWREGVRGQVQASYAMAARPSNGPISPGATSVLFHDAGELLTCLTRDLLAGDARQRWYWQPLLRDIPHPTGTALATLWSSQAAVFPTVLASLAISEATGAIAKLSTGEILFVTRALHASFDLPLQALTALQNTLSSTHRGPEPPLVVLSSSAGAYEPVSTPPAEGPFLSDEQHEGSMHPATVQPPWQRWLDNATAPSLSPQAHYLLGLGLSLCHAPAFARSSTFAQRTVAWLHELTTSNKQTTTTNSRSQVRETPHGKRENQAFLETPGSNVPPGRKWTEVASSEGKIGALRDTPGITLPPGIQANEDKRFSHHHTAEGNIASAHAPTEGTPAEGEASTRHERAKGERSGRSHHETTASVRLLPSDGWPTRSGGVLYLIHLLTWLNLPGGWDDEGALAEGMSGWAIVEALARGLSGAWLASCLDDPVWQLLAILDGREPGEPLGTGLQHQSTFRLPAQWLHFATPAPTWLAVIDDTRLHLVDADGAYLVVDVPLSGQTPEKAILAEVEAYRSRGIDVRWRYSHPRETDRLVQLTPPVLATMSESAVWWLERVTGFVRYFLVRRLGDPAFDGSQLAPALFERAGRLVASRTHIDLYMDMDQISLPIRRAGFDRDPGWMPGLGRIVLFHFD